MATTHNRPCIEVRERASCMKIMARACVQAASEGANGTSNGVSAATPKNDMTLPFEPITLAFEDLRYYVPDPSGHGELELLRGVYGVFRPGVLTALMGASGAGKTTLMDVLAGTQRCVLCSSVHDLFVLDLCSVFCEAIEQRGLTAERVSVQTARPQATTRAR